jgi:preprotein translocase subunit SecG
MASLIPVLLVIHGMIALLLIGIVLMQRSEGGALGMGGGGFMSGRGQANFLTRTTAYLAAAFFATSIGLTLLANNVNRARSVLDLPSANTPATSPTPGAPGAAPSETPAVPTAPVVPAAPRGGILDKLQGSAPQPK